MSNWTYLESSNIRACRYFRNTELLLLQFKNESIYAYHQVPWNVYMAFRRAQSKGRFFNREILSKFDYMELSAKEVIDLGLQHKS